MHCLVRAYSGLVDALLSAGVIGVGGCTAKCGRHLAVRRRQRPVCIPGVALDRARMRSWRRSRAAQGTAGVVDSAAGPVVRVNSRGPTAVIRRPNVEIAIATQSFSLGGGRAAAAERQ